MRKYIDIGFSTRSGTDFTLEVKKLLTSRLLIQANSGGGKSWAVRKVLEELHGKAQLIVLDLEDDFSTLREKFDFILAGRGGDIPVHPRTAEVFAHKVLELEADVIVNLYELKHYERIAFVKAFLTAMIDAPKELWHPAFVLLDEAHIFAPEKAKSESLNAVIDMASRGRKRGFCLIPATQRLSKLHKDVAAECQNKLIGLANMDIDRKRAADELGFTERETILSLRDLDPGEFFAVGPAFARGVNKIKIGKVKTTHHEAGEVSKSRKKPLPTGRVKEILAKLSDLPHQAEKELHDKAALKTEIRRLKGELCAAKTTVKTETKVEKIVDPKAIKREVGKFKLSFMSKFQKLLDKHSDEVVSLLDKEGKAILSPEPVSSEKQPMSLSAMKAERDYQEQRRMSQLNEKVREMSLSGEPAGSFGRCERAILKFLAMRGGKAFTKTQIGAMTLYRGTSGGFNNSISKLCKVALIAKVGSVYCVNRARLEEIKSILGSDYMADEPAALEQWLNKLGKCEREIFALVKKTMAPISKADIGEITGYSPTSGGFNNAISRLNTLGLIIRNESGGIDINPEILGI